MADLRQAVLLAAGAGRRLLPHTRDVPKCLVKIGGAPLLEHLLVALAPLELEELLVVTGWRQERLRAHLGDRRGRMRVRYVHNPDFRGSNNIVSLHLAAPWVRPPFMLLESDLYLEADAISLLRSSDRMLVAPYAAGMQGTGVVTTGRSRVTRMILGAHTVASPPQGLCKTVNACSLSLSSWRHLRRAVAARLRAGQSGEFYEAAMAHLIAAGRISLRAADISNTRWIEIDDEADLRRAETLIRPRWARRRSQSPGLNAADRGTAHAFASGWGDGHSLQNGDTP